MSEEHEIFYSLIEWSKRRRIKGRPCSARPGVLTVGISYAQLKYEGFHKRKEDHCSILLGVFHVSLFIFYHWETMDKDIDSSPSCIY